MASGLRHAGDLSGLQVLDETELKAYGPQQLLNAMLSTRTYVSTQSEAQEEPKLNSVKEIGKGQTGTVWALTGTGMVIKMANEGKKVGLYNDCKRHARIEDAFNNTSLSLRRDINIPRLGGWMHPSNDLFWNRQLALFPKDMKPNYGLISTRIDPLPLPVRGALVDSFAPKEVKKNKETFLKQEHNKDCLIRLYLGRRANRSGEFKLRNFDMTVNEMEYLRLDTGVYAKVMAETLAIVHWKAEVDANDVEFVLGTSPIFKMPASLADYENADADSARFLSQEVDFSRRSIGVWLLDFDQCQLFEKNEDGLKQLVRGFWFNDPYYPRPGNKHEKDIALWTTFKSRYLEVSAFLHTETDMPERFITAVEAEGKRRSAGNSLFN